MQQGKKIPFSFVYNFIILKKAIPLYLNNYLIIYVFTFIFSDLSFKYIFLFSFDEMEKNHKYYI